MRVYNGHVRFHCFEFQGVSWPDGMIGDLYGPVCGARHDSYIDRISRIMIRMALCQLGNPIQYSLYRDKAYIQQPPHGYSAHTVPDAAIGALADALRQENNRMKRLRLGIVSNI